MQIPIDYSLQTALLLHESAPSDPKLAQAYWHDHLQTLKNCTAPGQIFERDLKMINARRYAEAMTEYTSPLSRFWRALRLRQQTPPSLMESRLIPDAWNSTLSGVTHHELITLYLMPVEIIPLGPARDALEALIVHEPPLADIYTNYSRETENWFLDVRSLVEGAYPENDRAQWHRIRAQDWINVWQQWALPQSLVTA